MTQYKLLILGWLGVFAFNVQAHEFDEAGEFNTFCELAREESYQLALSYISCEVDKGPERCRRQFKAYGDYVAEKSNLKGCHDLARSEFMDWGGTKASVGIGYTSSGPGIGGMLLRLDIEPLRHLFDFHSSTITTRVKLFHTQFGVRVDGDGWVVDRLDILAAGAEVFFLNWVGASLQDRIVWEPTRGMFMNKVDARVVFDALNGSLSPDGDEKYVKIGTGIGYKLRLFYALAEEAELEVAETNPNNLQIPFSVEAAYSFLDGDLSIRGLVEGFINPLRIDEDIDVRAEADVRYNIATEYKNRKLLYDTVFYRMDVGLKYQFDYMHEVASQYGPIGAEYQNSYSDRKDQHRVIGFFEFQM